MDDTEYQELRKFLESDRKVFPIRLTGEDGNKTKRQQFKRKALKFSLRPNGKFLVLYLPFFRVRYPAFFLSYTCTYTSTCS